MKPLTEYEATVGVQWSRKAEERRTSEPVIIPVHTASVRERFESSQLPNRLHTDLLFARLNCLLTISAVDIVATPVIS